MNNHTIRRAIGLSLIIAGFGLATTDASAAGNSTLKIESMSKTRIGETELTDASPYNDDNGLVAISSTKVLVGGEDSSGNEIGLSYDKDVTGYVAADFGDETVLVVSDLATMTPYVFPNVTWTSGTSGEFTWDEIVKLDADGNVASRITLSAPIVVADDYVSDLTSESLGTYCTVLGSGAGYIGVWDQCAGKFWTIAVPSGTVTAYNSGIATLGDYVDLDGNSTYSDDILPVWDYCETAADEGTPCAQSGVLEYFDGAFHMALPSETDGNVRELRRFDIFSAGASAVVPTLLLDLEYDSDIYSFNVSPSDNMWCAHDESNSDTLFSDSLSEAFGCWEATVTSDVLPTTGSNSTGLTALGLGLVAMGAFVTVRSRRRVVA